MYNYIMRADVQALIEGTITLSRLENYHLYFITIVKWMNHREKNPTFFSTSTCRLASK